MDKEIVEIKKNLLAKKIKSYEAISELRDLMSENLDSDKSNKDLFIETLDGLSTAVKSMKTPDFLPVIKTIQENKPIELKEVVSLLKEILSLEMVQIDQQEPFKFPKDPKDAIPVVLTDKTKKDFYNAISSLPVFGGIGIDTSLISSKELQEQTIEAINNLEINAESINLNTDGIETLLGGIAGFTVTGYDYIALTYVAAGNGVGEIATAIYKTGGAGGTTIATLTLAYNASNGISSITKV